MQYTRIPTCVCVSLSLFVCRPASFVYLPLASHISLSLSLCISFWLPPCLYLGKYFKLARAKVVDIQREEGERMEVREVWPCLEGVLEIN